MIIFSLPRYKYLVKDASKSIRGKVGRADVIVFSNGEMQARLKTKVNGEKCLVLGWTSGGEEFIETLLLISVLKKEGAREVALFSPVLGYARQDKDEPMKSLGVNWLGRVLTSSGADKIITLDLHSERDKKQLGLPVVSISSTPIFADALRKEKRNFSIIAPDEGARARAAELAESLGVKRIACFKKRRISGRVKISGPIGAIGRRAVIFDDILDTGGTLIAAAAKLKELGVKEIIVCVTHGIFTGDKWKKLFKLRISKIYCVNSVGDKFPRGVKVLSIAPLLRF